LAKLFRDIKYGIGAFFELEKYKNTIKTGRFFAKKLLEFFIFLLLVFCFVRVWHYGQARPGIDFYQFWSVGQEIVQKGAAVDIYSREARIKIGNEFLQKSYANADSSRFRWAAENRKVFEIYSTPFLYSLFAIFFSGDYETDYRSYQLFCLMCSVFAIVVLCRLFKYSVIRTMFFLVLFVAWFEPFFSDVRVANVNQIQLGLLALFLWFQTRYAWRMKDFLGGIILGFTVMFKPNLVFVILMLTICWMINRRFRKITLEYTGIILGVIIAFIVSTVLLDSMRCWNGWFTAILSAPHDIIKLSYGNFGLAMLILDRFNIDAVKYLIFILLSLAVVFIWLGRRHVIIAGKEDLDRAFFEDVLMVAVGCLIYLLSCPLVWLHYFVLTIPAALFILRPHITVSTPVTLAVIVRRFFSVAAIMIIAINPMQALSGIRAPNYVAFAISVSTFTLYGLALWELKNMKERPHCFI